MDVVVCICKVRLEYVDRRVSGLDGGHMVRATSATTCLDPRYSGILLKLSTSVKSQKDALTSPIISFIYSAKSPSTTVPLVLTMSSYM